MTLKNHHVFSAAGCLLLSVVLCSVLHADAESDIDSAKPRATPSDQAPYQPTWDSLEKHDPAPTWFRDDKFGIYFHWGIYSVPAFKTEWYPRAMHEKGSDVNKHHIETYGDPAEYGYERFVDQFKAENFNAEEWCDLFQKAGARFVGPVAEHHDGFAMWDSEWTPWNSVDRGPKRDITGEMEKAARSRDLKFVTTFHTARNNLWEKQPGQWSGHFEGAKKNYSKALLDSDRALMYGYVSRPLFLKMWNGKLAEVIDRYSPDLIWFDTWLDEIPAENQREFLAHYLNHAAHSGQDVVVTYKQEDLPQTVGVLDIEKGGLDTITDFAWLTDDTISMGSWCYTEQLTIKPTKVVLHSLVDIVSKNGQLILNVSPMADGTIPDNQRRVLVEMGQWLENYGESIYSTRPFTIHGHGPTQPGEGHFGGKATDIAYTAKDVRYTQTKDGKVVYAIVLGDPKDNDKTLLTGFAKRHTDAVWQIQSVELLGSTAEIDFALGDEGLTVSQSAGALDPMANVYKIKVKS